METQTELVQKIEIALDQIRPFLQRDGGDVELVDVNDEHVVRLRLLGACGTCDISHLTMKAGIEDSIRKVYPEVAKVIAVE